MNKMLILYFLLCTTLLFSQTNHEFNITLDINYRSAEKMFDVYEKRWGNTSELVALRGNQIAYSTSAMIEEQHTNPAHAFTDNLQQFISGKFIENDYFQLQKAKEQLPEMRALLDEIRKRNFSRKVVATIEQLFPKQTKMNVVIPVYVVAFGTEKVDAFVRRITWENDVPHFVGEGEGELTIVINLSAAVELEDNLETQFIGTLSTVAHEVFHVAFGFYQDNSKRWKKFHREHNTPADELFELVQNEGIAYHFSIEQRIGGNLPREWGEKTREAMKIFIANADEILSMQPSDSRAYDIIRRANTSGFWENYGSISGMFMARAIEKNLGRKALTATIAKGVYDFFKKYDEASQRDKNLPMLSEKIKRKIFEEN